MGIAIRNTLSWLLMMLLVLPLGVAAEDDETEEGEGSQSIYVAIEPAFVTNYGGPGRLRYMKVEVSLRVKGAEGETAINRHLPLVKDTLLSLFAIQTNESIGDATGKEALRKEALAQIGVLLTEEEKSNPLEDVLFTGFVVHR